MFNLDFDERKRYNRVVWIAFLIGAGIFSLLGYIGTRPAVWGELGYVTIQDPRGGYFISEIEPFPWWFPIFGFFGGGWFIGGVAGGTWLGWQAIRRKTAEIGMSDALLLLLSPLLLWLAMVVGMMPGIVVGVPYAIHNAVGIKRHNKSRVAGEMSTFEMNVHGKQGTFMYQLFKAQTFDEQLFEAYFDELKILSLQNARKEMLKLAIRRNDEAVKTIHNHFLPDHPRPIKNIPATIGQHIDKIHTENQRLIQLL